MHTYIFQKPRISRFQLFSFSLFIFLLIICWPAATWLQSRKQWASPENQWDAIYLVCGARAQNNRIKALDLWMKQRSEVPPSLFELWRDGRSSSVALRAMEDRQKAEIRTKGAKIVYFRGSGFPKHNFPINLSTKKTIPD